MFVAGNFLDAVATILGAILSVYQIVVIVYALMSWISPDPYNTIVRTIHALVDPFLDAIRKLLPFAVGTIDFTPFIGILILMFTQRFLVGSLHDLAWRLR
jgi:YggT family protein